VKQTVGDTDRQQFVYVQTERELAPVEASRNRYRNNRAREGTRRRSAIAATAQPTDANNRDSLKTAQH